MPDPRGPSQWTRPNSSLTVRRRPPVHKSFPPPRGSQGSGIHRPMPDFGRHAHCPRSMYGTDRPVSWSPNVERRTPDPAAELAVPHRPDSNAFLRSIRPEELAKKIPPQRQKSPNRPDIGSEVPHCSLISRRSDNSHRCLLCSELGVSGVNEEKDHHTVGVSSQKCLWTTSAPRCATTRLKYFGPSV